jgi:hypothetical protein
MDTRRLVAGIILVLVLVAVESYVFHAVIAGIGTSIILLLVLLAIEMHFYNGVLSIAKKLLDPPSS